MGGEEGETGKAESQEEAIVRGREHPTRRHKAENKMIAMKHEREAPASGCELVPPAGWHANGGSK